LVKKFWSIGKTFQSKMTRLIIGNRPIVDFRAVLREHQFAGSHTEHAVNPLPFARSNVIAILLLLRYRQPSL
jgi:hypothetical protein